MAKVQLGFDVNPRGSRRSGSVFGSPVVGRHVVVNVALDFVLATEAAAAVREGAAEWALPLVGAGVLV